MDALEAVLLGLSEQGCFPCISYRGKNTWRAHVNGAGNFWAEANTPEQALSQAVASWEIKGKPVDGYAAIAKV